MDFQEIFDKSFGIYKNECIGIYGTGKNAKRIIGEVKGYQICFFIDDNRVGDVFEGFPVVSIVEAVKNVSIIIIAAIPSSTRIVFDRIGKFLTDNILVFDMYGHQLNYNSNDYPYWNLSFECLCDAIDSNDIISFDIFDTLLMRRVLYPEDVFLIIDRELKEEGVDVPFAEWRLDAERKCAKWKEPSFNDIYNYMKTSCNLSDETINKLKKKEFEWEKRVVCARTVVVDAFEYAKRQKKLVYLLSDMYFSREKMEILLSQCGIQGYKDILISNEYNKTKETGALYLEFISRMGNKSCILHIGDNVHSDVDMARLKGISSFWVMNARDMLYHSSAKKILYSAKTLDDRILLGEILSRLFNNPFALCSSCGKIDLSDVRMMANTCFVATAMNYLSWILKMIHNNKNTVLLFASRDCYFFYKVYKKISEILKPKNILPDAIYFYMSRKAIRGTEIKDEIDINIFLDKLFLMDLKINLGQYLYDVFQIDFPDCFDRPLGDVLKSLGEDGIAKRIYSMKNEILNSANEKRKNYRKYLIRMNIKRYKKIILIDTQTTGTGPRLLSYLLSQSIQVFGIRFLCSENECSMLRIRSYSPYKKTTHLGFNTKSTLLEKVYASSEKQLRGFDENGEPIFDAGTEYDEKLLSAIQNTMMNFIDNYLDSKWYTRILSNTLVLDLFDLIDASYSTMNESTVSTFETIEIFDSRTKYNVMKDIRGEL